MIRSWALLLLLSVLGLVSGCAMSKHAVADTAGSGRKITFDLSKLNAQGLYGPPDGLRALDYEFCIPADPAFEVQVKAIDQTIVIFAGSKGRVGCVPGEKLCIGNTHQPEFKTVLFKLAGLPYVKHINQCFYE